MELLNIKVDKTDKGFQLSVASEDEDILDYWGARILAFVSGECTCSSCNCSCGGDNGDSCSCKDEE
jgi:hypothetical protein